MPAGNPEAYVMNPLLRGGQMSPNTPPGVPAGMDPRLLQLLALMAQNEMGPAADAMGARPPQDVDMRMALLQSLLRSRGVNPDKGGPQALQQVIQSQSPQLRGDASAGGEGARSLLQRLLGGG